MKADKAAAKQPKAKAPRQPKKSRRMMSMSRRTTMEAYVFMLPFLIGILLFFLFPMILLFQLSFSHLDNPVGLKSTFVGFQNFSDIFFQDLQFVPAVLNTLKTTLINVPLTIIFSLLIAILVNKDIKCRGFFRTVFFLPFLLGNGYVMQQLLQQDVSGRAIQQAQQFFMPQEIMNYLGQTISGGLEYFFSIIIVILWGSGVQILLFLSGLQGISPSYYEAARVESANEWECFWHITLPMMSPIMLLNIVYSLVDSFTRIDNNILQYSQTLTSNARFDYASAVGLLYALFVLVVVLLVFLIMRKAMFTTETRGGKVK